MKRTIAPKKPPKKITKLISSVVTVGDGRGFVIGHHHHQLIVTAAHCLPHLPPRQGYDSTGFGHIFKKLLGPLGKKRTVWAECFFVDPISDIAVLGSPDNQSLFKAADDYEALLESVEPIPIGDGPEEGRGWLLSLEGEWFGCTVNCESSSPVYITHTAQPIKGGMSGSPIILGDGTAIGVLCASMVTFKNGERVDLMDEIGSANPRLMRDLPGWLIGQEMKAAYSAWFQAAEGKLKQRTIIKGFPDT